MQKGSTAWSLTMHTLRNLTESWMRESQEIEFCVGDDGSPEVQRKACMALNRLRCSAGDFMILAKALRQLHSNAYRPLVNNHVSLVEPGSNQHTSTTYRATAIDMGGRLSTPKGADGMNESSKPHSSNAPALTRGRGIINGRTIMAPLAALTMAGILFVYARTSIRAAKLNAQKHREADGGQISWHKESLRRHGQLERLDNDSSTLKEALVGSFSKDKKKDTEERSRTEYSKDEEELRRIMGKKD
ncbi:hypothetical protein OPT61_g4784 [Boeremia exigua]|uniref:Uncharacterized protein n=1 Tax=Boeremia exigua TaxID=749465 RepID=A0ACC2ICZ6_9PLEO|nr:hypothetical protein OPT61_g4784 [Boeremia exigua]